MATLPAPPRIATGHGGLLDERRRALLVARLRLLLVGGVFVLLALAACLRILFIGTVQASTGGVALSDNPQLRAEIVDRNGVPMARAFPAYALRFNPEALEDGGPPLVLSPEEVAERLGEIFPDMDRKATLARFKEGKKGYLRRRVLPADANKVQAIGELALEFPRETDRHYPHASLAAHALGYVDQDGQGHVGMESVLNDDLRARGVDGEPIALSIDMRVQGALEDELRRGMQAVNALGSAGIVLDVETGEVLALASLPDFDPNDLKPDDISLPKARRDAGEMPTTFNRVTNQVYEMGSIFKPLSVAAAIDAGVVTDLSRQWDARPFKQNGHTIKDYSAKGETLNVPKALIVSSNTVTARVAEKLGEERLKQYMADLGMSERPYIELPARGHPIWPNDDWQMIQAMTISYGHGVAVTPLHAASAYAAMVNGGIWRPATLRKIAPGDVPRGRRVFKASTSARMNQLLRMIAVYGTGRNADAPGFRVGGKTGSAEKPGRGGYRKSTLVSTFAAAFPMDKPRYVVIAMLDEPKGTIRSSYQRTAAWNAAPIVGRLVPRIGPQLGVYPDATRDIDLSDLAPLVAKKKAS